MLLPDHSGSIHLGMVQCSSSKWTELETIPTIDEKPLDIDPKIIDELNIHQCHQGMPVSMVCWGSSKLS